MQFILNSHEVTEEYFKFIDYYDFSTVQCFQALFILVTENMWGVLSAQREGLSGLPEVMFYTLDWKFQRNFQIKSANILSFSYFETIPLKMTILPFKVRFENLPMRKMKCHMSFS